MGKLIVYLGNSYEEFKDLIFNSKETFINLFNKGKETFTNLLTYNKEKFNDNKSDYFTNMFRQMFGKNEHFDSNNIMNYVNKIFKREKETKEGYSVISHINSLFGNNQTKLKDILKSDITKEGFEIGNYLKKLYNEQIKTKEGYKIVDLLQKNGDKPLDKNDIYEYIKYLNEEKQQIELRKIYIEKLLLLFLLFLFVYLLILLLIKRNHLNNNLKTN